MGGVMTRRPVGLLGGALAGILAAAVALGVSELVAGITGPQGGPVVAVGGAAIDMTPVPVKDFAIAVFGTHDKTVLIAGLLLLLAVFAALIGALALRWLAAGLAGLAVFGALGVSAALTRPAAGGADVVPTLAGVAVAAVALTVLIKAARGAQPAPRASIPAGAGARGTQPAPRATTPVGAPDGPEPSPAADEAAQDGTARGRAGPPGPDRRRFLAASAGTAVAAAAAGGIGDVLLGRFSAAASRADVRLPAAARRVPGAPPGADLGISGLSPFFTPNERFYRVDTDLVVPQITPGRWTLRIGGLVGRDIELTFADLLKMPLAEHDMTLVCVSNEVGGPYAGNARWLGVSLPALLRRAGIRSGADQVLSTGADGMTISTPVPAIMDGRTALIAVGMNGQPLPVEHGFPARMIVPGLYGYVSATKWVTRLEVTTFARQRSYWSQRGYAEQAPIKTEARIDVPKPLAQITAGPVAVAGVAWAPHRGIAGVEVNVDGGRWHPARLAAADGIDTWRQWTWAWDAPPGLHTLQVRATDGTGATQTSSRAGVFPSGATGWDSVVLTVT
jgi:DMSO/TMAO reductase YedYZ molybdopterin-dependent catalytic subunit